jgi:precorrin-8X/cobalt-precorrin-8 methylmutase
VTVAVGDRCTACGACLVTCPQAALVAAPRRPLVVEERCTDCLACVEVCPVDAIESSPYGGSRHPIEVESYRIMSARVDLSAWSGPEYDVVARMVHATADPVFATSARVGAEAVSRTVAALRAGVPVVCDSKMVVAGIPAVASALCLLDEVAAAEPGPSPLGRSSPITPATPQASTRSAAAFHLAASRYPDRAVWVIGNAPTALAALLDLAAAGRVRPAAVVGLPVGYVGAAASKERLWQSDLGPRSITNRGDRGGSPVAAAAVNALYRLAVDRR